MNGRTEKSNAEIREQGGIQLQGNWGKVIRFYAIAMGLIFICFVIWCFMWGMVEIYSNKIVFGNIVLLMILCVSIVPIVVGIKTYFLMFIRGQYPNTEVVFKGYEYMFSAVPVWFFKYIIIYGWGIITIVVFGFMSIIRSLDYSMVYYIINDNPHLNPFQVLKESKNMMQGYKWKLFGMHIYFLGLRILCIFTLGIGFIWLLPYIEIIKANFYEEIKASRHGYASEPDLFHYQHVNNYDGNSQADKNYQPQYNNYNGNNQECSNYSVNDESDYQYNINNLEQNTQNINHQIHNQNQRNDELHKNPHYTIKGNIYQNHDYFNRSQNESNNQTYHVVDEEEHSKIIE